MAKEFRRWVLAGVKKTIVDYGMLASGDRVAVGLSGGKDSAVLLHVLNQVRRVAPVKFELHGVFIDAGWPVEVNVLREFCRREDVPFYYKPTDIAAIVFDIRQEKNPCSLCANLRRGALHSTAGELGCNKVALGHHLDDVLETFLLNLFFTGRFQTFTPVTFLDRSGVTVIRPLACLPQEHVHELARLERLPVLENPCPASGRTRRQEVRQVVTELSARYPDLRERFLHALQTAGLRNLWPARH
ncbi:tRNA 2-thiocytidine biosynthesis TtcA family protein [Desulfotomaculum copahuensis]|uniref:tRNA 2-thiocytidine biosynthesis protein TtcA n=1 Tax=Desulfotomaculum copahuensis TaxID=1838280 RepID=A0A1B7LDT1_9FIRM|nr:ATP-binding protein [Desulfotomaculum copahuensis]OAT81261.1 tRNA 2-thiocytidine biosynthesis protein TtcA [Desulfotomaculum copahuensis]